MKKPLGRGDRIWLWVPRLVGVGLAVYDSLAGNIDASEGIFYALLIFGPEAVRLDLLDREK